MGRADGEARRGTRLLLSGTRCAACIGMLVLAACASSGRAAELILNEYNAVSSTNMLENSGSDTFFGQVLGNGGDWFELVVIRDRLDIRGWQLELYEDGLLDAAMTFTNDPIWSDLRAGTLVTVSEQVADDVSYNPIQDPGNQDAGDWWINVRSDGDPGTSPGPYISQTAFKVNNDDWQLVIRDDQGTLVYGPVGEGTVSGVGVNSREVFKLEASADATVSETSTFYDDGSSSSFGSRNVFSGGAGQQDLLALRLNQPFPDRDGDGLPDDGDFSGVVGDAPCDAVTMTGCDDNCPLRANTDQADTGSINALGPDWIGNACQCGDVGGDDGAVTQLDIDVLRNYLVGLTNLASRDKCGVAGSCDVRDAAVMLRAVNDPVSAPGLIQGCPAATEAIDQTDLLFDPDRVLDIDIVMNSADWNALRNQVRDVWGTLGPGCFDGPPISPYTFFPADVTIDGQLLPNSGVRKKGFFGSASTTKPSLKIDFTEFAGAEQAYLGMDRLTLNNSQQDPALIKQCLGYDLFRQAGIKSSRCNFATVSVNGTDLGVFVNVEGIKEPFLARNFGDDTGNLYEGALSDFRTTWVNTFEKKTNESSSGAADLDAVVAALDVPSDQLEAALGAVVDLPSFYTYWAMEALIAHWDGYHSNRNNFWFYFNPVNGGRAEFIPWGIDAIFAGGSPLVGAQGAPHPVVLPLSKMTDRLYLNPTTQSAYIAELNNLLATVWDEAALLAEVDRMEALLLMVDSSFQPHVQAVRDFITGRRAEVTAELAGGPPPWNSMLPSATCLADVGNVTATIATTWGSLGSLAGSGTLTMDINNVPETFSSVFSEAGAGSPVFSEAGAGELRVVGFRMPPGQALPIRVISVPVQPEFVTPGVVDLPGSLGFAINANIAGAIDLVGLLVNIQVSFTQGGSSPGDPVAATITADVATGLF